MKISIFGLGYVGAVTGACFAKMGHTVIGADVNETKVQLINDGLSPIIEKDMPQLMQEVKANKSFRATRSASEAISGSDVTLICVGTPSNNNGKLDLSVVKKVCEEIGVEIKSKKSYQVIVVRSTMLPGSVEEVVIPMLEAASGKKAGVDFGVVYNPEFMREGSSIYDFYHPPMTIIGGNKESDINAAAALYQSLEAPLVKTGYRAAEAVKYVSNIYHALKITFANEIGTLCKELMIDSHEVMDIFNMDKKLNISSAYLKPSFAFGGSCLPKDLRALTYKGKELDLNLPLLNSILNANQVHIQRTLNRIYYYHKKNVGILGLSFKAGTDDLRESPMVMLVETLIGKGYNIKIYDKNISLARLVGSNKKYIEKEIPHISSLLVEEVEDILQSSEVIILGNKEEEFQNVHTKIRRDQIILDLCRAINKNNLSVDNRSFTYDGICW